MNTPNQDRMRKDAIQQAADRARREGVRILVWRRVGYPAPNEVTWYVRSEAEGEPPGSVLEWISGPLSA